MEARPTKAKRLPVPHIQVKQPRCPFCGAVLPKPYTRRYFSWGQVHYCKCKAKDCRKTVALDVI